MYIEYIEIIHLQYVNSFDDKLLKLFAKNLKHKYNNNLKYYL